MLHQEHTRDNGAKRPVKLPQRYDRADTLSDACQAGEAEGDVDNVPAHQPTTTTTKSAEAPELSQDAPLQFLMLMHSRNSFKLKMT